MRIFAKPEGRPVVALIIVALGATVVSAEAAAQPWQYTAKAGQEFAYRVDITADRDDATETLQGVVAFTVRDASEETIRMAYQGGLTKTSKPKPGSASSSGPPGAPRFPGRGPARGPRRGPGGPPGFGGPSIFSNPFDGLRQTSNELVISPRGEVRSLQGSSQLPYLLGNLSILFFEPLPVAGQTEWTVQNGVSITSGGGRDSRPPFHRPAPRAEQETRSAASESTTFAIEDSDQTQVVAKKTYRLNMPGSGNDATSYEITGTGKWIFNRQLQVPESLEFEQRIVVRGSNTTVTIPVSIRYSRLSAEELAAHQQQREEAVAALKQQLEERKNAGKQGLPDDKKREILANLTSDKTQVITRQMVQLKIMKPHPDDKDIALLIQKHLNSENRPLRVMSQAAWGKWKVLVEEPAASVATTTTDNPFAPPGAVATMRTWKDATGKFSVEAEFVSLDGDALTIKRKDGKTVTVPLSRLSQDDQTVAKQLAK